MLDARHDPTPMQRSRGHALVGLVLRRGAIGLARLEQGGSARAFLPRVHGPTPEVVFLNTSGGMTGGDRLSLALDLGCDVSATATTQTAERAYASAGESAEVEVKARVGARGRLDWLPQETILYERSRLNRRTEIDLAADAALLMVETVVLGRLAMGEAPVQARLSDRRTVRRAGRPVWHETLRLDPGVLADAALPAVLGGARAMAVVALVAPGATDALGPVRAALGEAGVAAAASAWDGRCLVRMLAPDGWPLRRQLRRVLTVLRTGRPLPRVWQM